MPIDIYNKYFSEFLTSPSIRDQIRQCTELLPKVRRIFFIGNGGSNAISSHMMEDYAKMGRFPTFSFSDPALITCYANDYGYENAMAEWLKIHFEKNDLLVAISSSGESKNILNAAEYARCLNGTLITLSGFKEGNSLSKLGMINFYIPISNYGVVECLHHTLLHIILDTYMGMP